MHHFHLPHSGSGRYLQKVLEPPLLRLQRRRVYFRQCPKRRLELNDRHIRVQWQTYIVLGFKQIC